MLEHPFLPTPTINFYAFSLQILDSSTTSCLRLDHLHNSSLHSDVPVTLHASRLPEHSFFDSPISHSKCCSSGWFPKEFLVPNDFPTLHNLKE